MPDTHVVCEEAQEYVMDDVQENNVTDALFVWLERDMQAEKVSVYIRKQASVGAAYFLESDWDVFSVVAR